MSPHRSDNEQRGHIRRDSEGYSSNLVGPQRSHDRGDNTFPAPNNCGDGTMAEWTAGKFSITQADYGKMQVLPTIDEWNRLDPEGPMLR
jgi:hypothetical protein